MYLPIIDIRVYGIPATYIMLQILCCMNYESMNDENENTYLFFNSKLNNNKIKNYFVNFQTKGKCYPTK